MWIFLHGHLKKNEKKEKFKDTIEVIRSSKSKKDRQYNDQKTKNKRTNNDVKNPTKSVVSGAPEGRTVPASHVATSCYSCYKPVDKS